MDLLAVVLVRRADVGTLIRTLFGYDTCQYSQKITWEKKIG